MRILTFSVFISALSLTACVSNPVTPTPSINPGGANGSASSDTLRYSIDPSFAGRTLLLDWYHVSFESPLAVRTLADRPVAQAFAVSGEQGILVLPAIVDPWFEFYARFAQYVSDEGKGQIKQRFVDSAAYYEAVYRWALAPLVVARTDELARLTLSQLGAGESPKDSAVLQSGYVLLWVRDSIDAEKDGLLTKRKLTGKFKSGWHLLQYKESGRTLTPVPISDTVKLAPDAPKPNLV
jgi:hypothetical protein